MFGGRRKGENMFASIVISTYNRAKYLQTTLESWTKQDYPPEKFELLIIDNGSTDNTREVAENFQKKYPGFQVRYVYLDEPCLSCARNKGIEMSRGEIVAFVDDDAEPSSSYLAFLEKYVRQYPGILAFGGKVLPKYETGKEPEWMSPYLSRLYSLVDLGDKPKKFDKKYPVGCNMLFRKEIFDLIGKFDIPPGLRSEDKHFFLKVKRAGLPVIYLPEVKVWHFIDNWRLNKDYVRRISCLNGYSDHLLYDLFPRSGWLKFKHFTGLFGKTLLALLIWVVYAVKGKGKKGKYLFTAMSSALRCFLFKKDKI